VRALLPPGDISAGYAVQSAWVAGQVAAGDRVVGRKIGLTSVQLAAGEPDSRAGIVIAAPLRLIGLCGMPTARRGGEPHY
jgi:2-keto-4-pentenoate hydratase